MLASGIAGSIVCDNCHLINCVRGQATLPWQNERPNCHSNPVFEPFQSVISDEFWSGSVDVYSLLLRQEECVLSFMLSFKGHQY